MKVSFDIYFVFADYFTHTHTLFSLWCCALPSLEQSPGLSTLLLIKGRECLANKEPLGTPSLAPPPAATADPPPPPPHTPQVLSADVTSQSRQWLQHAVTSSSRVLCLLSDGTSEGLKLTSICCTLLLLLARFPWCAVVVRARCLISQTWKGTESAWIGNSISLLDICCRIFTDRGTQLLLILWHQIWNVGTKSTDTGSPSVCVTTGLQPLNGLDVQLYSWRLSVVH